MGRKKIKIGADELRHLYHKKALSYRKIGKILNCSETTIQNRIEELGIKKKSKSEAQSKYPKKNFSEGKTKQAYLIGFRIGDLNVYKPKKDSKIIVARCHTTQKEQIKVMQKILGKYGKITISESAKHSYHVNCYLNQTFNFLLSKKVPLWIKKSNNNILNAFVAGYVDAEGNFIINQGRGRFKIDSYDKQVLKLIKEKLEERNLKIRYRKIATQGEKGGGGQAWNQDLWRLNINEARSLQKFIQSIKPYMRHETRLRGAQSNLRNIQKRIKNGTVK